MYPGEGRLLKWEKPVLFFEKQWRRTHRKLKNQIAISPKPEKFGIQLWLIANQILRVLLHFCFCSLEPVLEGNFFSSAVVCPEKRPVLQMGEKEAYLPIVNPTSVIFFTQQWAILRLLWCLFLCVCLWIIKINLYTFPPSKNLSGRFITPLFCLHFIILNIFSNYFLRLPSSIYPSEI